MNDSPGRGHPLHISGPNYITITHRIPVLHLPLEGNRNRLEAPVRVLQQTRNAVSLPLRNRDSTTPSHIATRIARSASQQNMSTILLVPLTEVKKKELARF